jgi:hypothetical protein
MNAGTISYGNAKGGDGCRANFTKYDFTFGDFVVEVKILLVGSWFS